MRITALAGLFVLVAVAAANSSSVSAQSISLINNNSQTPLQISLLPAQSFVAVPITSDKPAAPEPKQQATVHEVGPDETLSSIAEQYKMSWVRLFNKNEQLANPDIINAGDKLTIPLPDEVLKDRPLPEPPVEDVAPAPLVKPASTTTPRAVATANRGAVAGNMYSPGYCTWYAKNRRPDLPNNLGNANTWVSSAAAQGIPTGSVPRVGAIGQQGMHVVYVEGVNGDGTVNISEMNYRGLYVISTRTVPASTFLYIY